jgi:NADP-dependent 3-hydroxy acid dehydrogenase YdfG
VAQVLAGYGRIDVLVNNAGNGGTLGLWAEADAAALRDMFNVHVFGAERVARAVLPAMTAQGAGTIVNIASTVA